MQGTKNLTEGPIKKQLFNLALPIMGTSFIQMAYSITDMAWVGRLGSEAVAAIGAVGILTWMTTSISYLNKVGSEVSVAQSIGAREEDDARAFASHNLTIALMISVCWGFLLFVLANPIISFFKLDTEISGTAVSYLKIVATGFPFIFLAAACTGIYNAAGLSKIPFYVSGSGLIMNMVLDPLFIFGFGMGTNGAACATWLSEATVLAIFNLLPEKEKPAVRRIPVLHPVEKPLQQTNLSVGASRSTAKQSVCRYQPDDGTHGLHLWRTYRTDDDDSRRTDRSDRLEYLARIQHGSKHVRGAKLCRPEKRTCPGCLPYDTENDCPVRNLLYVAFRVLRQRSILTDHTRKGRL